MRNTAKIIDITGQKYNHLTVVRMAQRDPIKWECLCDCGNTTLVRTANLKRGMVKSCGCLQKRGNPIHNKSNTRLYRIYKKMVRRCYVKDDPAYNNYGGRGIDVCDEWKNSFSAFCDWAVNNGYTETLSIDRINNDLGYSPSNCRWANRKEQSNNRRSNRMFEINGVKKDLTQWCEEYGMPYNRVWSRISNGWDIKDALLYKEDARIVKRRKV